MPSSASALLSRNLLIYGVGGLIAPFIGIKLIDLLGRPAASRLKEAAMLTHLRPAIALTLFFTLLTGLLYPLAITGAAQAHLSRPGQRLADHPQRHADRLGADRPELDRRQILPRPALGGEIRRLDLVGQQPRASRARR